MTFLTQIAAAAALTAVGVAGYEALKYLKRQGLKYHDLKQREWIAKSEAIPEAIPWPEHEDTRPEAYPWPEGLKNAIALSGLPLAAEAQPFPETLDVDPFPEVTVISEAQPFPEVYVNHPEVLDAQPFPEPVEAAGSPVAWPFQSDAQPPVPPPPAPPPPEPSPAPPPSPYTVTIPREEYEHLLRCKEAADPRTTAFVEEWPAVVADIRQQHGSQDDLEQLRAMTLRLRTELITMKERTNAAYEERNRVVAALATIYPATKWPTKISGWNAEWHNCVYIELPTGQVSWHYHDSQKPLFSHVPRRKTQWDGHSTAEKYRRITRFTRDYQPR